MRTFFPNAYDPMLVAFPERTRMRFCDYSRLKITFAVSASSGAEVCS
jgi:hypothetical protein